MGFIGRLKCEFKDNYFKLAVAVIVAAAVLRFALAALSHPAGDACWHLSVSRFIAENGRMPFLEPFGISEREVFAAPPLYHVITASVYKIFSLLSIPAAEFAVKFVSPLFGTLSLPFIFLLGRKLFNSRIGFFATLFVAFLPLHMNASAISFVESLALFLAVVSVYLLFCRRIYLSAVFMGLGLVSKQHMFFMLPLFFVALLVYYRQQPRIFLSKSAVSGLIMGVIGLPWFIRNYVLLGNPLWPYLYKILGGKIVSHVPDFSVASAFFPVHAARFYLESFGVPLGSLAALSFVSIPFSGFFISAWLAITFVFFFPVVAGLFSVKKHRGLVFGWLALFLVALVLYVMNTGGTQARLFLPALPALAIIWAVGLDRIFVKAGGLRLLNFSASVIVIAIVVGSAFAFSAVEAAKAVVGANEWAKYQPDFNWVKSSTPENALVGYRGQCLGYNIHRPSNFDLAKVDYVWVNQNFRLEPVSVVEPEVLRQVEANFTKAYENEQTGTVIYRKKG
ncbi:glycosyltransferase family 39 protein [Candidatus Woesearchaeota archaeon]|nr:glycosyltransferase family 39 protein [Candidatus Woesearchaeota archaeon]